MLKKTFALLVFFAATASAAELHVGPGQQFGRIEQAVAAAAAGDAVVVHPQANGAPYERVALFISLPRLTLRAAEKGKHIALAGTGFDYSGDGRVPRAIVQFNPGADGCTIEGFELS